MSHGRGFEGAAYRVTERLDITEIAKRVRVNLRNAQEMGALPEGMTYTVTIDRYAGGQAMDINLSGMPDTWTYVSPGLACDYANNVQMHGGLSSAARAVEKLVQDMVNAYNRDDSDSMTDYFDVRFYGHVKIQNEQAQWWENQERAVRAAQKRVSAERKAAGRPTRGQHAQCAAARAARDARNEYAAAHPRPVYSGI